MSTNIQIRSVPDELAEAAKRAAEASGVSLSEYIRRLLEADIAQRTEEDREWWAEWDANRREMLGDAYTPPADDVVADVLREIREHGEHL